MANSIKIGADTSDLKRSLLEVNRTVKDMGRSKVSFLDKDEREFLSGNAQKHVSKLKTALSEKTKEIKNAIAQQGKLTKGSEEELKAQREIIKMMREKTALQKNLSTITSEASTLGGAKKGAGILGMLGKIPGLGGGLLGGAAGMIGKLGPLGLGLGVAGLGISRAKVGMDTFNQGIGDRVRLQGLGINQQNIDLQGENINRAGEAGLSQQDFMRQMIQAANTFGRAGAGQESVISRAEFERNFGLEQGQLTNIGTTFRAAGMGGAGAEEAVAKLQASILASGIDDAIGPYLETATQLLGQINENGNLNSSEILGVLSELSKNGADVPEQVAKSFQSMQNAITQSSGEANAFFQGAFARAGIGGGTIGATQAAIESGGLFGLDEESLQGFGSGSKRQSMLGSLRRLGITGDDTGFQERSTGILNELKQRAGLRQDQGLEDATDQQKLMMGRMAQRMGMGQTAVQGLQNVSRLEEAAAGDISREDFKRKMEEQRKSPELKNLDEINKSGAGQLDALKNIDATLKDVIGNRLVPISVGIEKASIATSKAVGYTAKLAGFETEAEKEISEAKPKEMTKSGFLGFDFSEFQQKEESKTDKGMMDRILKYGRDVSSNILAPDSPKSEKLDTKQTKKDAPNLNLKNILNPAKKPEPKQPVTQGQAIDMSESIKLQKEMIQAIKAQKSGTTKVVVAGNGVKDRTVG